MMIDLTDTAPEIDELQIKYLRDMQPEQKLALVCDMSATVKILSITGLKARYPDDSLELIQRRLADLILGKSLAQKVYGMASYD